MLTEHSQIPTAANTKPYSSKYVQVTAINSTLEAPLTRDSGHKCVPFIYGCKGRASSHTGA